MAYEPSTPTAHTPSASASMMPLFDPRSMIPQLPGGSPTPAPAPPAGAGDAAAAAGEDDVAEPHLGAAPGHAAPDLGIDGNEESCGACGYGGELLCCENCPAVFHAHCHGYMDPEETPDEWECYACAGKLMFNTPLCCMPVNVGQEVMVAYKANHLLYYRATVSSVTEDKTRARVTYTGWQDAHDEEIALNDTRLWRGSVEKNIWSSMKGRQTGSPVTPNAMLHYVDPKFTKNLKHPQKAPMRDMSPGEKQRTKAVLAGKRAGTPHAEKAQPTPKRATRISERPRRHVICQEPQEVVVNTYQNNPCL